MRKEADIVAGTQYRMAFDDAEVVRTVTELEDTYEWLKFICEQNKWEVKVKFITEGGEEIQRVLNQIQQSSTSTSTSSSSAEDIDNTLANMVQKNQSKLSQALRRSKR